MTTIWIYHIPGLDYLVAKPYAFGCQIPNSYLYNGQPSVTLQQGVPMTTPAAWDSVEKRHGLTFATLNNVKYEISELSRTYFTFPR